MVQSAVEPPREGRTHAGDHAPAPGRTRSATATARTADRLNYCSSVRGTPTMSAIPLRVRRVKRRVKKA